MSPRTPFTRAWNTAGALVKLNIRSGLGEWGAKSHLSFITFSDADEVNILARFKGSKAVIEWVSVCFFYLDAI